MSGVVIVSLLGLSAWGVVAGVRADRRNRRARSLIDRLRNERQPLYCVASSATWFQVETVSGSRSPRRPFVVEVCEDCLTLYPLDREAAPEVVVRPENLRWFGRPRKYHPGTNEIWLDVEIDGEWRLIKVRLTETHMRGLVRALKEIASEEQISAYRRRRPYIHFGPVPAHPATQDMLGAWALGEPLTLYLTPLHLVLLRDRQVARTLPLDQIQNIAAVDRLDAPSEPGLVRFQLGDETLAFAVDDHQRFAALLGEAARRTLEDPVEWQRKKKKPGDADGGDEDE